MLKKKKREMISPMNSCELVFFKFWKRNKNKYLEATGKKRLNENGFSKTGLH